MALVYRIVPSLTSTIEKFGSLNKEQENLEGILYDLGYISFEETYSFFNQEYDVREFITTFKPKDENHKSFFLFSYDALIHSFRICSLCYAKYNFELLEYDIPKDLLLQYCGYDFYKEKAYVTFCIPESEFKKNATKMLSREQLADELSKYKELKNRFHENKGVYPTHFITGKRNLYDTSELYKENDFLSFQEIMEQLNQKGITHPNHIEQIYEMFKKRFDYADWDTEDEVKNLQKKLAIVLK